MAGRTQGTGKTQSGQPAANEQVWHQAGEGGVQDTKKRKHTKSFNATGCPAGRAESIQDANRELFQGQLVADE